MPDLRLRRVLKILFAARRVRVQVPPRAPLRSPLALFQSALGQDLTSAKGTLWVAERRHLLCRSCAYADRVRSGPAGDRLDGAWFGAGHTLKEEAWTNASALVS